MNDNYKKLICMIMGGNCENVVDMCIDSVKDFDKIYFLFDSTSRDNTIGKLRNWKEKLGDRFEIMSRAYDHSFENKNANGEARNFYLKKLIEQHNDKNTWCLVLDADEVLDDDGYKNLKQWIDDFDINQISEKFLFSIKMRHFVNNLGYEDATQPEHFVPCRFFKVQEDLIYPEIEHPVLHYKDKEFKIVNLKVTTIWHLGAVPNVAHFKERFETHMNKSNTHSADFLNSWYRAHLFGKYPIRQINLVDIPKSIYSFFHLDKDEIYFANRGLEMKHFLMSKEWLDYFKPAKILEYGCGRAPFGYAIKSYGCDYSGIELSNYAVNTSYVPIKQGNILTTVLEEKSDLVILFDVLEHIDYSVIDIAIRNAISASNKYLLVSVPVVGDPNLEADKTHIIKEDKEWWINKFTENGLKQIQTPEFFSFKDQIMIFEK